MNNLMLIKIYFFQPSPLDQVSMLVDLHHSLLVSEVEVALLLMVQSVGLNPQPKVSYSFCLAQLSNIFECKIVSFSLSCSFKHVFWVLKRDDSFECPQHMFCWRNKMIFKYILLSGGLFINSLNAEFQGEQWLNGKVLDLRPRGCGFEPCWPHF